MSLAICFTSALVRANRAAVIFFRENPIGAPRGVPRRVGSTCCESFSRMNRVRSPPSVENREV